MKHIVHFTYRPEADRQEIAKLIPAEQAKVAQLHKEGILEAVYISNDVKQGWLVFASEDANSVSNALESLPLYSFWSTELVLVNTLSLG